MEIRKETLPVLKPCGGIEEAKAAIGVIESGWWGKGPKVEEFEQKFAEMVGAKFAIAVNSATSGQDLVLKALDIQDCDVINPTISFMTTGVVPLWNGCTSNIVDVQRDTLCLDPDDVKSSLRSNTKAIIAVNMAGVPADIDSIRTFYDGLIIEDTAHSCYTPGAGSKGDVAVWSFQAVKTMACGDGCMITTNDENLYNKMAPLTWLGISSTYSRVKSGLGNRPGYTWDYDVDKPGIKCYMIDMQAAICLAQIPKLPQFLEWRRHIQNRYNIELAEYIETPHYSDTVQYYCARVNPSDRDNLINYLADKKIHTSVHFKPLHKFKILGQNREYPVADTEWLRLLSLPCHNCMTSKDIDYVIYWVKKFYER